MLIPTLFFTGMLGFIFHITATNEELKGVVRVLRARGWSLEEIKGAPELERMAKSIRASTISAFLCGGATLISTLVQVMG